jgi:hypothetical protein
MNEAEFNAFVEMAKDAFYEWETEFNMQDLSDDDMRIWCAGYVMGKHSAKSLH